jgi:hypothetical protein
VTTVSSPTPIPSPAAADQDSGDDKHYVLVIHGTFSAIEVGKIKWFQLDEHDPDNFCRQLNERLAQTPLGRAVWRNPVQVFSWSGENGHAQRLRAAKDLCGVMTDLVRRDPSARIHLVAHSHGGNVALKAIELYYESLLYRASRLSTALQSILMAGEGNGGDPIDEAFHRAFPNATTGPPEALKELLRGLAESLGSEIKQPLPLGAFLRSTGVFNRGRLVDLEWSLLEGIENSPDADVFFGRVSQCIPCASVPKSFARTWVNSRVSNRLGRVVFLGTPFFRKRWVFLKKGRRAPRLNYVLHNLYILPVAAVGPLVIVYIIMICMLSVVYLLRLAGYALGLATWPPGPHWDPTGWPAWLSGASVFVSLLFGVNVLLDYYLYYNINMYFDTRRLLKKLWLEKAYTGQWIDTASVFKFDKYKNIFEFTPPGEFRLRKVPALVVTAPYLDEALLGLSSEPMVYANLVPRIEELLYLPRELRALRAFRDASPEQRWGRMLKEFVAPAGSHGYAGGPAGRVNQDVVELFWLAVLPRKIVGKIVPLVIKVISVVIYIAVWSLWVPLRAVLRRYLTSTLVKAVSSAAFGLPASELRGARIEVRGDLEDLSEVFEAKPLPVTEKVLCREQEETPDGRALRPEAAGMGPGGRYAHLVDPAELKWKRTGREQPGDENAWKWIHRSVPVLYRRDQAGAEAPLTREQYEDGLARAWFTLEERAKEAFGAVELIHCLYYTNPTVIEEISKFLAEEGTSKR